MPGPELVELVGRMSQERGSHLLMRNLAAVRLDGQGEPVFGHIAMKSLANPHAHGTGSSAGNGRVWAKV